MGGATIFGDNVRRASRAVPGTFFFRIAWTVTCAANNVGSSKLALTAAVLIRIAINLLGYLSNVGFKKSGKAYSQTALSTNLQVVGLQHLLVPQPSTPPQSQSSPASTIPFPHSFLVMMLTSLLEVRHEVLTLRLLNAEQMFPTEQGLKASIRSLVDGFMRYAPPASQTVVLSGQHIDAAAILLDAEQVGPVQSCTAPMVWPISCAMTFHSVEVLAITLAPLTV